MKRSPRNRRRGTTRPSAAPPAAAGPAAPPESRPAEAGRERRIRAIVESPSYSLAFEDHDFLMQHEQRPVRLQLELLKPENVLRQHKIKYTIVAFGGTRIVEPAVARARVTALERERQAGGANADLDRRLAVARRVLAKARYYDEARAFARLVAESRQRGETEYVIVTGGGPGIMEAANRGAFDVGMPSIGLNITLPHEQQPNSYITPSLCFQFHYFAIRKMHFLLRARALVAFPGGYGTLDELFETLTLMQTGKTRVMPVVLFGREFWEGAIDFQYLADEGVIADRDLGLFQFAETAQEAWDVIRRFHAEHPPRRSRRS
jgi:uncharacterized protein (TIGR00730 family)